MINRLLKMALAKRRPGILFAGHGVASTFQDRPVEEVHIDEESFVNIITFLEKMNFQFVSMNQLDGIRRNSWKHERPWCHLSFDDGYKNNLSNILPILQRRKIPFTVFISVDHIVSGELFPTFWLRFAEYVGLSFHEIFPNDNLSKNMSSAEVFEKLFRFAPVPQFDNRLNVLKGHVDKYRNELSKFSNDIPMNSEEVATLASFENVDIGSHSNRHIIYHSDLDLEYGRKELEVSREYIQSLEGQSLATFCYPNGDLTPEWKVEVDRAGYVMAFASHSAFVDSDSDRLELPRFWLSTAARTRVICMLSLFGNRIIDVLRPRPR